MALSHRWSSLLFVSLGATFVAAASPLGCSASKDSELGSGGSGANNSSAANGGGGSGGIDISQGGGSSNGGSDACAAETSEGELVPLDLHVVLDRSASMQDSGKWGAVTSALQAFITDPSSNGVGIGLQYFPVAPTGPIPQMCDPANDMCGFYGPCVPGFNLCSGALAGGTDSCDPADYDDPQLTIQPLPGVAQTVIDSIGVHTPPDGASTPSQPAMEGAAVYATAWAAQNPSHLTVIILATDGDPTNCNPNSVAGAATAAGTAFAASPSVQTFVVGVGAELGSLNQIAAAGGTGQAFLVDTGGNVTQQFIDALNEIRASGQCQLQIPVPTSGTPDYGKVNVTIKDPNSSSQIELFNVGSEGGCDPAEGGWYYDDPANPNIIFLCPASCGQVTSTGWDVEVLLGCETLIK